jgi:hypothetical protein
LIDFGQLNPSLPLGHPFSGVQSSDYWSSTTGLNALFAAWHVRLDFGFVGVDRKEDFLYYVWPVRGGQ